MNMYAISILLLIMVPLKEEKTVLQKINDIQWSVATELPAPGVEIQLGLAGVCTGISNNVLLVAGGANFPNRMPWQGGKKKYWDDIYILKKVDSTFKWLSSAPFKLKNKMAYGASVTVADSVVCIGGETESGLSKEVFLLQWDAVAKTIVTKVLPPLPFPVTNAGAATIGNTVFIAGGETPDSVASQFLSLDLANTSSGWKELHRLPKPVSHALLVAQCNGDDNGLYLIGGRMRNSGRTSDLYASVYRFDLKTNNWKEKKSLPYALSAGTGIATGSRHILLFGGDKGETFQKTERLVAAINRETNEARKEELNSQKIHLQSTHPGFSKEVLQYNTLTDVWSVTGSIPLDVPVTTTAIKWGNFVMIPSGEIKAGVRTRKILAGNLPTHLNQ